MIKYFIPVSSGLSVVAGLYYISINNWLLFHGLIELFSVIIAMGIFMIVCTAYNFMENAFVLNMGAAYLFIGILDVFHIFAYKGMGIFPAYDANLPTQLWIQARFLESLSICMGLYLLKEKNRHFIKIVLSLYPLLFCILITISFSGFFPDCYIEGFGLTAFKKISEYLIALILLGAVIMLQKRSYLFDKEVVKLLYAAIFIKIASELAFTLYVSVYGFFNFTGHILKAVSFYLLYRAVIKSDIAKIIHIAMDITKAKQAELELRLHQNRLEELVKKRTHELGERIKELNCLYNISRLCQDTRMSIDELFREIVNIIPRSWQYPESACARIIHKNREFKTKDFIETEWRQACDIVVKDRVQGKVEVFYKEKKQESDKGPFLKEERSLIISIAEQLANIIVFKGAQDALKKAKETAEAANRAKTLFLANMNHELRTPLNSILGFAQIIHSDPAIPAKHRENTRLMLKSGEYLLNLINDILEIARIESGRVTLNKSAFNLAEFMDTLKEFMHQRLKDKDIQFNIEYGPNLPDSIKTDDGKLRQILINLLGNAVKFTQKGNISLRIFQEGENQDTKKSQNILLNFEIEDTGQGIPAEDIEFIFKPFSQSRDPGFKPEGTGLGLTITRDFIRLMGGKISVNSRAGAGSTFKFHIPILPVPEYTSPAARNTSFKLVSGQHLQRILIVDDNKLNRMIITEMLESAGFIVNKAVNGQEAVEMYKKYGPDLIWMDLMLPGIDGVEAAKIIRRIEAADNSKAGSLHTKKHTPIIALSAASFDNINETSLTDGCDDFLSKPFLKEDIYKLMQKYLGVKYINDKQETFKSSYINHEKILSDIAELPSELFEQIEKNIVEGNHKLILLHIDKLSPINSELADNLGRMVHKFEYKKLLSLISESRNKKHE